MAKVKEDGGNIGVEDMITHRLSLDEASLGFQLVASGKESIKVILNPNP